ncbi:MAG: hypothetical protein R3C31_15460 [Hyphomonadaceae bacterium]
MNASPLTGTNQTTASTALWRVAEAFMHILAALFGGPAHVAAQHTLTLKAHQLMASWLRCGEAMMRRLLLIEAAAFAKPNVRPLLRAPRSRKRRFGYFYPDAPQDWRVSFRCFQSPTLRPAQRDAGPPSVSLSLSKADAPRPFIYRENRPPPRPARPSKRRANRVRHKPILRQDREWVRHQEPLRFRSAWGLALRYEALLRAYNDPRAYARRLSRTLHAKPHRAAELLRAPPEAANRIDRFCDFGTDAESSRTAFDSS